MVERKSDTFDVTGSNPVSYKKQRALIYGYGEIGRHARFRSWFVRVNGRIPPPVLNSDGNKIANQTKSICVNAIAVRSRNGMSCRGSRYYSRVCTSQEK